MIVSFSEIRERLQQMLGGNVSLGAFEDWFALSRSDIHRNSPAEAQRFALEIDDKFSQYDEDCDEFRAALAKIP